MIRVDYHFHPNLPFFSELLARKRAEKIWENFDKHKLDVVFVTEHVFKRPAQTYRFLHIHKPQSCTTYLVPGVEALAKEGVELIVFSRDEYIYKQKAILTPYHLGFEELIDKVLSDKKLFAIIVHPFVLSDTALIHHVDERELKNKIKKVGLVEKYNSSTIPLRKLFDALYLNKVFRKAYSRLLKTEEVPDELIDRSVIAAGGSDAHHPWAIGSYLQIDAQRPKNYDRLFDIAVFQYNNRKFIFKKNEFPALVDIAINGLTIFFEGVKKRLRLFKGDFSQK